MAAIPYEPAIDGLRALAILAVCTYHLNAAWLPGGFAGVDVFFVISGFLITRIITAELDNGTFSLTVFYRRRVARIAPALLVSAWTTLLVACLLYSAQDKASAGMNFIASLLSFANIKFMLQGSYFDMSKDAQPFLHFWSLSVEEQFYFIFPIALAFFYKKSKRIAFCVGLSAAVASFAMCVWLTPIRQSWAFYLLPTRAWELLCGALVCHAVDGYPRHAIQKAAVCLSWVAVIGLALSLVFLREDSRFPGSVAALPVLATAALMWSIGRVGPQSLAIGFLRQPLFVAIGRLSYSIYLWHWPVFSFVDYSLFLWPDDTRVLLKVGLSVLLAMASYALVESPARGFLSRSRNIWPAFSLLSIAVVAGVFLGFRIRQENYLDATPYDIARGGIVANASGSKGTVVLVGDSYGSMYGTALREGCRSTNWRLIVLSNAGGWPFPDRVHDDKKEWRDTLRIIQETKPQAIVIACAWDGVVKRDSELPKFIVESLKQLCPNILLVDSVPSLPDAASREGMRHGERQPFLEPPSRVAARESANAVVREFVSDSVVLLDASRRFLNEGGEIIVLDGNGCCRYHDRGHLSGYGSMEFSADFANFLKACTVGDSDAR